MPDPVPPTAPTGPIADPAAPRGGYREVTVAAILFAVVIGVVMNRFDTSLHSSLYRMYRRFIRRKTN